MIDTHDYRVELVGNDEKTGTLSAARDQLEDLVFGSPPEFGGPGRVWSPEHLFVAALSSCLMTTFRSIAARSGVDVIEYRDEAVGRLRRSDDGLYSIDEVTLRPTVIVSAGSSLDRTERLIAKAEKVCLISRSVQSKVHVRPIVLLAHQVGT